MSVLKIEFHLYGEWERAVMNEAITIIEKARAEQQERLKGNAPAGQREAPTPPPSERPAHPDEAQDEKVVGTITPAGAKKAAPAAEPSVKETEMAEVVQKALDTLGLAKTREIVGPFTGEKRWRESDPAVWPQIKAALEQAIAEKA